ncbi:hypothetical protein SAMN07250955_101449 [Arboricoccus pini]|uniref:Uncharacterized protein n=1 Tax=Arboricoccus pini TaxID=1963835 RepID=A0A212Q6B0_9PROT|nr:hypothetical protein [Arboricoccus pini]SNB54935.1 hypothetical protein SAMN07250955_101449 [Arboricoccus pini]
MTRSDWPRVVLCWVIGLNELLGGAIGLYVSLPEYLRVARFIPVVNQGFILLGIVLFAVAIIAGLLLMDGRPQGWNLSLWVQGLQILSIQTSVLLYELVLGCYLRLSTEATHLGALNLSFGGGFNAAVTIGPAQNVESFVVSLNLLAILAFAVLVWLRPRRPV